MVEHALRLLNDMALHGRSFAEHAPRLRSDDDLQVIIPFRHPLICNTRCKSMGVCHRFYGRPTRKSNFHVTSRSTVIVAAEDHSATSSDTCSCCSRIYSQQPKNAQIA